jgi:hypothetical protein
VASEKEDNLGPVRRVMGKVASLNKAIKWAKGTTEEGELRDLGRKLGVARKELMSLGWVLIMSQDPSLVSEAHELFGEVENAIRTSLQDVKAALGNWGGLRPFRDWHPEPAIAAKRPCCRG